MKKNYIAERTAQEIDDLFPRIIGSEIAEYKLPKRKTAKTIMFRRERTKSTVYKRHVGTSRLKELVAGEWMDVRTHGTPGYRGGCRCAVCKQAKRAEKQEWIEKKRIEREAVVDRKYLERGF